MDVKVDFVRHTLAALAYRAAKPLRTASPGFANYAPDGGTQTAARIVAHMGDLLDWALSMAQGAPAWHDSTPLAWDDEVARFFAALTRFDEYLASGAPIAAPLEKLFQGPIADALTHVGQLAMMRRLAGDGMGGENYFVADIEVGCTGLAQAPPRKTF